MEASLRESRNVLGERYGALETGTRSAWDTLKEGFSGTWSTADEDASAN